MKVWFVKLHRWIALVFALPIAVVILTGLVLSFEPWLVTGAIKPGALSADKIEAVLRQHDPKGQTRAITYRSYDHTLTLRAGRGGGTVVDAATGERRDRPSATARALGTARGLHEVLLIDAGWLVTTSTLAMLVIIVIGVLIGWPRFRNTLAGWHISIAWCLLPLVILSPLTGLMLAWHITFATPAPAPAPAPSSHPSSAPAQRPAPLPLAEAVQKLGQDHDLSSLIWMRPLGGRLVARIAEGGEYRLYAVTREGVTPLPRNWPRLWHEGNFAGAWSAAMNAILSIALLGLLVTGVWAWLRRQIRKRARRLHGVATAAS